MQKLNDIIGQFPSQSFRQVYESKLEDLRKRAVTDEHKKSIVEMSEVYKAICDFFDSTVEYLRETIKSYMEYEIEDLEAEELAKILQEHLQQINRIQVVDIGTPEFNTARQEFNSVLSSIQNTYLQKDKSSSFRRFILSLIQSIKVKPLLSGSQVGQLNEAFQTAKKLNSKINTINSAYEASESLLAKREVLIEGDIEKKINDLSDKAGLHSNKSIWLWFWSGCVLGFFALLILLVQIHGFTKFGWMIESVTSISFGAAVLRFGLVSIIFYFALYCIKQFSIHRHLHQLYSFKAISLRVMLDLRGEMDELEKKLVLAKGLEAIFSEPSTGILQQSTDHSGDYWQTVQRILERLVTKNADTNQ